jgi:hypothetical protein
MFVLSCVWVTIHGFWIDDRIYCTLWYSAWLNFTIHYYTHTSVHSHVFISRCLVAASNGGRSPSSGFPNYTRPQLSASHSNSSQRLNLSSFLTDWLTQSLTNQVTQLNSTQLLLTVLLIISRHWPHRKHRSIIAVILLTWKHACLRSRY